MQEAEELASKGCREVILIAQDVTEYGRDLYGELMLAEAAAEALQDRRPAMDPTDVLL